MAEIKANSGKLLRHTMFMAGLVVVLPPPRPCTVNDLSLSGDQRSRPGDIEQCALGRAGEETEREALLQSQAHRS